MASNPTLGAEDFEFTSLSEAKNYRHALVKEFSPFLKGNVIEIGAGIGQMTAEFRKVETITRLQPVEPDADFCKKHRENHPDLPVLQGYIDDVEPGSAWDAVVSINVLEHIEKDQEELCKYAALLAQNEGHLCLYVPARPEIYAPIDKDFGHFRRYTKPLLSERLAAAGLEIVTMKYFNYVGYFSWWFNFCILKKRTFEIGKVRLFDRLLFPVTYWLESKLLPPPIGQSLLVVARSRQK